MSVHRALEPGFLESVYQNALAHEFKRKTRTYRPRSPRTDEQIIL